VLQISFFSRFCFSDFAFQIFNLCRYVAASVSELPSAARFRLTDTNGTHRLAHKLAEAVVANQSTLVGGCTAVESI
jgi:hypothetical protein